MKCKGLEKTFRILRIVDGKAMPYTISVGRNAHQALRRLFTPGLFDNCKIEEVAVMPNGGVMANVSAYDETAAFLALPWERTPHEHYTPC